MAQSPRSPARNPRAAAILDPASYTAALVLGDGTIIRGQGLGAIKTVVGEVCFNTGMSGYQETISDPSYAGQIITFTFPHIGNVGTNQEDVETATPTARGVVLRGAITEPSNFRALAPLDRWLSDHGIPGICGIDTRRLTRHIRIGGAPNGALTHDPDGQFDEKSLNRIAADWPGLEGTDLAAEVSTEQTHSWSQTRWQLGQGTGDLSDAKFHVVAVDYGAKHNILRSLASAGCRVTVVPATSTGAEILAHNPDGVFLSNGPGDPAATGVYAVPAIQGVLNAGIPLFAICLGHQLLALALGAKTKKMHQGHRGANHPVKDLATGKVEITSQNHGFVVDPTTLPAGVTATHESLFDGTCEGLAVDGKPVFSVQYHPEASPGPHDSRYLFERFTDLMHTAQNSA